MQNFQSGGNGKSHLLLILWGAAWASHGLIMLTSALHLTNTTITSTDNDPATLNTTTALNTTMPNCGL